ncbi:hypothetical protein PYW08_014227 [Mythimna loreyi]|uniref:Uncharacterized protein n=1 Tax=Mythimna loreyi TaxID=667449 RepID=A0ACC2R7F7_9NEOP|nr:hypothetical protein PYW08_014227 [Mythimna loreyi]
MTSEAEAIKTNEFLRRRKLRLQQVREQSKDIAKKIRQRAKVEKLRQVVDLDAKKQKEYFECQEKLVKRLEELYAKGLENVGASHHSASELIQQDDVTKTDKSKLRGKEATVELRRKKQEKLDQQKKLLDRKVQAREAANEISRDKSSVLANKLFSKSSSIKVTDDSSQKAGASSEPVNSKETDKDVGTSKNEVEVIKTSDMATQWDMETIPEWEPVPALSLPTDKDTPKDSDEFIGSKVEQSKRLDLFAISKEMPTSLRGKHTLERREKEPGRPSLTIVSEYLQNRKLRLRETEPTLTNKKTSDDMQSLKQTIERTRSVQPEGIDFNICQVHDQQIIPVPIWQAERRSCRFCSHTANFNSPVPRKQFKSVTNSQINQIFSSIRPVRQANLQPSPVVRGRSPFRRNKVDPNIFPGKGPVSNDKAKSIPVNTSQRKSSVVVYNHSTRDTRDLPHGDDKLVVRDLQSEEDAYSQAMKEVSALGVRDKEQKKVQDMRNKVAVTKQNVEKEYKDTMNFLNSLPKDKGSKVIKNAYMDERRQQIQHESRQQKMQQEYKKIEKECKKHNCLKNRNQTKSPVSQDIDDNFDSRDFQYSWMPVPEADGNLAIHTIPNTVKQGKSGNSVKFSQVDSYHEYRSRHKHTPPTKDTSQDKPPGKRIIETVLIDKDTTESSDSSSITSDTSSIVNLRVEPKRKHKNAKEINQNLSDAERIIIYKVLDSKTDKKSKRQTKLLNEIAKSLTCIGKGQQSETQHTTTSKSTDNALSFEQLNEGIYKVVEEQGAGYKMSCCTTNVEMWQSTTPHKPWWDNIASMYYDAHGKLSTARSEDMHRRTCHCKSPCKSQQCERGPVLHWESGDCPATTSTTNDSQWPSVSKKRMTTPPPARPSSVAPSTTSFTTAPYDKDNTSEGGYIKLLNETGQAAGKFIIDSSGLLNNNAYEVVIQLRKKDKTQETINMKISDDDALLKQNIQSERQMNDSSKSNRPVSYEADVNNVQPTSDGDACQVLSDRGHKDKQPTKIPPQPEITTINTMIEEPNIISDNKEKRHIETNTERRGDFVQSSEKQKNTCDKGISTCLSEEIKVDQLPRRSTTTCTQTTLSSPVHRPVFFHMSSSTSTAYMSPPEMILPNFLRHDCPTTEDDIYDPIHTIELIGKEYREEFGDCMCRKCMYAKKMEANKLNVPTNCSKKKHENLKKFTPPNNTNNTPERHQAHDVLKERNVLCKSTAKQNAKCTHSNRRKVDHKGNCHRNRKLSAESFRSTRNINTLPGIDLPSRKNKYKCTNSYRDKKPDQSRLNPIIRDYVNKLLALNRQGLKAVEVADQECSSVGTPGSSIINVPFNVDERKSSSLNTISLEQIKNLLKQKIVEEQLSKKINCPQNSFVNSVCNNSNNKKGLKYSRTSRKKPVHKVKSLNISKHFLKQSKSGQEKSKKPASQSSAEEKNRAGACHTQTKMRSRSPPTPRQVYMEPYSRLNDSVSTPKNSARTERIKSCNKADSPKKMKSKPDLKRHQATATESTLDSESSGRFNSTDIPVSMSTQTTQNVDINTDTNYMKLAEDKLQNMEKIADLTEKCTRRLSNLARVLEEVRKNKSLAYSQISSAESTDSQSDKPVVSPITFEPKDVPLESETKSPEPIVDKGDSIEKELLPSEQINVLADIPKPAFKVPVSNLPLHPKPVEKLDTPQHVFTNTTEVSVKNRPKPPPALSRLSLKHGQEYIIPHELSTVIEVDSPMSIKHKNQSARNDAKEASNNSNRSSEDKTVDDSRKSDDGKESAVNPDLLQTKSQLSKIYKFSSTESSDDSKFQMIDLKQFNEIMLEPFISIQEYAKQYNMEPPDEGSNLDDIHREEAINDDISSLHSDGSLPDVIAELLKRNIITEPFKFDTASNINSTTISSESTLSMLALSKARRGKRKTNIVCQNKENIGETSDTLSFSSNPDLENAFKKLGMGWASSTLKKTKERLALSSSSNTSSSSLSQFKTKKNQEAPALVADSVSSLGNVCKSSTQNKNTVDNSKNAEQQTTFSNSMTVKEFLRNELAKKITFTNKSNVNNTQEEFVSLFETKMPEEMKESSQVNREERSVDSARSGTNRARTSTPVQLFKSLTYRSSSSSNISNGLFSNADDLSSVKMTSNSNKNHSTSDKDDLTIPTFSLRLKKNSDCSKSD